MLSRSARVWTKEAGIRSDISCRYFGQYTSDGVFESAPALAVEQRCAACRGGGQGGGQAGEIRGKKIIQADL